MAKTNGKPTTVNGHSRKPLGVMMGDDRLRPLLAKYDAAQTTDDNKNHWANADSFDADSANSRDVREALVARARYETANNGYTDGIARTYATAVVGTGPKLRMQTGSTGFNQLVEAEWDRWTRAVDLRRKLWAQAHAKHMDGEGFGVARTDERVPHPVKLEYVLYETEQFQSPYLTSELPNQTDGIRFDDHGRPTVYELLRNHPGSSHWENWGLEAEQIPAQYVMHWFHLRRPGQHRGVPEIASTLSLGAQARRWREATIAAAETAADFSVLLKTIMEPNEIDIATPFSTVDFVKRMMVALPEGYEAQQMRAEHPGSTYEMLNRSLINEQARPISMPYNVAACDSSDYNYASGRLDHQTYHAALDVDRQDCGQLVLTPLFGHWFTEAVRVFGWLGGNPEALSTAATSHKWDWPKHRVADVQTEAKANETRLRTGQVSLSQLYSENGMDYEDQIETMASDYGIAPDEMRQVLMRAIFNIQSPAADPNMQPQGADDDSSEQ